jgi:hypothetical protein
MLHHDGSRLPMSLLISLNFKLRIAKNDAGIYGRLFLLS